MIKPKIKTLLTSAILAVALVPAAKPAMAGEARGQAPYRYAVSDASARPEYVSVVQRTRRRYAVKRRSKKKSVAIVAGSAAAGAGIGALAGGGKGAAIGAASGAGAGFVYDRMTHKKVVRK